MIKEKTCFKCGGTKPLSAFYKHPGMADGHLNKCKECNKRDVRENRNDKIDYYLAYDRMRANIPKRVEARKAYAQTDHGIAVANKSKRQWSERNTIKAAATIQVARAVRGGRLAKPDACEVCEAKPSRLHGHHDDYALPLSVRWLCAKCHRAWHRANGCGANG